MTFDQIKHRAASEWEALQRKTHVLIGTATCGRAAGSLGVARTFEAEIRRQGIDAPVVPVGCMGLCYAEPLVVIVKPDNFSVCYNNTTTDRVRRLVEGYVAGDDPCLEFALGTFEAAEGMAPSIPELPRFEHELRHILRHCGHINPESIDHYISHGGYGSLAKALSAAPSEIISQIKRSGLRGRGGAGFPAGAKWEMCHNAPGRPKYVICNADEGDPGAFMDRALLESDPHSVLEGMIVAGYVMGAAQGYIYVRDEYPLAVRRFGLALKQAEAAGFLGKDILGSGFSFRIEVAEGAGAFVCGEAAP